MSDAWRRGIRTLLMVLAAAITGLGVLVAGDVITGDQAVKVGAVMTFLSGIVSAAINGLEDRGTIPALLKAPASDGADPVG